jgi:hypothetical protein
MRNKSKLLVFIGLLLVLLPSMAQNYKNTYVREALVAENDFRTAKVTVEQPESFKKAQKILPSPFWKGHEKEMKMYWDAWKLALKNVCQPKKESGFVSSYVSPAYNGNIFMWDDTFITMFCRYGNRFFNFQQTLDNFYAKQHPDGFICREIRADGTDCFHRYDPVSTGPNIIPWSELLYFKQYGDVKRLNRIFPVLCAYYKWLKLNRTWRNGTYWSSGWGTGMDNMPRVSHEYNKIFSHGHMIWLDACLQQVFMADILLEMGFYLERWQEIEEFEDEAKQLSAYINKEMWSKKDHFLYDQYADGKLNFTKGVYAYWAFQTHVLDSTRVADMVKELDNPKTFKRLHRVPSLSSSHPKYKKNGRYWQGGVWSPSSYMVVSGLLKQGYRKMAYDIAKNHYENVFQVYKKTGTFWEYYSPEKAEPGFMARPDFVGWTGLPPIAMLIEHIFGIRSNAIKQELTLDVHLLEEYGIQKYPFGKEGLLDIHVYKRTSQQEKPQVMIKTNVPVRLTLYWGNKKINKELKIGNNTIK